MTGPVGNRLRGGASARGVEQESQNDKNNTLLTCRYRSVGRGVIPVLWQH